MAIKRDRYTQKDLQEMFETLCEMTGQPTDPKGDVHYFIRKYQSVFYVSKQVTGSGIWDISPCMTASEMYHYLRGAWYATDALTEKAKKVEGVKA